MSALRLELAAGADPERARLALEAAGTGPVRASDGVLSSGAHAAAEFPSYVASTTLGVLSADRLRPMLQCGLVPRRVLGPGASSWLWAGVPVGSIVEGVSIADPRSAIAPSAVAPSTLALDELEQRIVAASAGSPVLVDGSLGARALVGLLRAHGASPELVHLRWDSRASPTENRPGEKTLSVAALDLPALFDEFLETADVPTVSGFEAHLLDALATRGGLPRLVSADGASSRFAAGAAARAAGRGPRLRLFARRFRPAADALDVAAARTAEIGGLARAPIHRVSSLLAVLPAQTREALARFGPRAIPLGIPRGASLASIWSTIASLELLGSSLASPDGGRIRRPFADRDVRLLAARLPDPVRFRAIGTGGPLTRWASAATETEIAGPTDSFDAFLDAACRGALASRIERCVAAAARCPGFRAEGVGAALDRFRAGTHGWTGRAIATIGFLADFLGRERMTFEPAGGSAD